MATERARAITCIAHSCDDLSVYQEDWANELHPTISGFSLVSNRFAEEIHLLP